MRKGDTITFEIFEEPYPCEGCEHVQRCKENQLSCKSFHTYVMQKGKLDLDSRSPSRVWYQRTFVRKCTADVEYEALLAALEVLEPGIGDLAEAAV
jgi:hypothetical protein